MTDLESRLQHAHTAPRWNCASMSLATVLPGRADYDLLYLAEDNTFGFGTFPPLIQAGLYRHGYYPILTEVLAEESLTRKIGDEIKGIRMFGKQIEFMGAIVRSSQHTVAEQDLETIEGAFRRGVRTIHDVDLSLQRTTHAFGITDVAMQGGYLRARVVDTDTVGWEMDEVPPIPTEKVAHIERRAGNNPFFGREKAIIVSGLPMRYIDQDNVDLPRSLLNSNERGLRQISDLIEFEAYRRGFERTHSVQ